MQREEPHETEAIKEAYVYNNGYILIEKEGEDTYYSLYDRGFDSRFNERRLYAGDEMIPQYIAEDVLLKQGYASTAVEQTDAEWLKEQVKFAEVSIRVNDECGIE